MTDNEIIRALECCKTWDDCKCCPYCVSGRYTCGEHFNEDMLDFINRQKAEIERLNRDYSTAIETMSNSIRTSRTEAVKEFAERLKEKAFVILYQDIDNLLKELGGEN